MIKKQITNQHIFYALILGVLMLTSCGGGSKSETQHVKNEKTEKEEKVNTLKPEIDSTGEYVTVKLNKQFWMAENLHVAAFKNGDPIPEVKSNEEWLKYGNNKKPAWCYYNNDAANGKAYGKLYNYFAVNDKRGIAPEGYHVATKDEWEKLDKSLSDDWVAVMSMMKSTTGWGDNNNGTNESGFNALPSGGRFGSGGAGKFMDAPDAHWWTSDFDPAGEFFPEMAAYQFIDDKTKGSGKGDFGNGFAVRCVKD